MPILAAADTYSVVAVRGPIVTVYTAKSQSVKAMGSKDFQASKDAVLALCADMISVEVAQLDRAAQQRAAA
jgi:hypothetical protein